MEGNKMSLTKEQMLTCEKIEKNGGPRNYASALLYHQYKLHKKQLSMVKSLSEQEVKKQLIQKVQAIHSLEEELEEKDQQLKEKKIELQKLIEIIAS
jgi:uncharacterized protein (DUF3084 family)